MNRLVIIGVVFVSCLAIFAGAVAYRAGVDVMRTGHFVRPSRIEVEKMVRTREGDPPRVVWIGDSTMVEGIEVESYAGLAAQGLEKTDGIPAREHALIALVGLDFFHYYCMLGRVLELEPKLIVVVAHLRMFKGQGGDFMELCSFIPGGEIPRALTLPFQEKGVGPLELLGFQLLDLPGVEKAFLAYEGTQRLIQDRDPTGLLVRSPTYFERLGLSARMTEDEYLSLYDVELTRDEPTVEMMVAALEMARERGVEVLVIASPIPYEKLEALGVYRPESIDLLRQIVEENGGRFLDAHRALTSDLYRDDAGHYTAEGASRLAGSVAPAVGEMLR